VTAVRALRAPIALRPPAAWFLALAFAAPALLGISRVLPDHGGGLAIRLAAAGACVLLLPGALVVRALGWPDRLGVAVAAALAWSLGIGFVALALTFAAAGSLSLTITVVGALAGSAFLSALRVRGGTVHRSDLLAVLGLVAAGLALGAVVWWTARNVGGDGLFHLARVRKLDELPALGGLGVMNEFRDGGLHPGYAFPLWHGELALVARLADVDAAKVVQWLPALLVPLALVVAYGLGSVLLGSWGAGLATAAAQAGVAAFPRGGVGSLPLLSLPATASRLLLVPAVLVLALAFVRNGRRVDLAALVLAALALAVVHPTYALFVCLPLGGFLVARLALAWREGRDDARSALVGLAGVLVPTVAFLAWLVPVVRETAGFRPDADQRAEDFAHYATMLDGSASSFHVAPEAISRGGAVVVLGLLAVPLLVLARRARFAAFGLGATLAVLGVLLVSPVFTEVSSLVSLSQSRRLVLFLPLAVVAASFAVLLGRLRWAGLAAGAGVGVGLALAYPGDFGYRVTTGGPGWAVWVALGGGLAALALARLLPWQLARGSARWTALAGLALMLPVAVDGLREVRREPPDRHALSAGLVAAVREDVPLRGVVFADLETSYRLAAFAPVSIAAAPPAHVAATKRNRPLERRADVVRFYFTDGVTEAERRSILARYRATWFVATARELERRPEVASLGDVVYADPRFTLLRLVPAGTP
jgi:hypothetical protein